MIRARQIESEGPGIMSYLYLQAMKKVRSFLMLKTARCLSTASNRLPHDLKLIFCLSEVDLKLVENPDRPFQLKAAGFGFLKICSKIT